jgi:hypothetical protein
MAFGLNQAPTTDYPDIVRFDGNSGRVYKIDYDLDTREKVQTVSLPFRAAGDLGRLMVGYGHWGASGPEFLLVPEGQPLPEQPQDRDEKGGRKFRPMVN